MDPRTVHFYEVNAAEVGQRYACAGRVASRYFLVAFVLGATVLDVGCGEGRDLHALIQAGYEGTGVDASENMLQQVRQRYPALAGRIICDSLPNLAKVTVDASYDGVLCSAVLMHLPE